MNGKTYPLFRGVKQKNLRMEINYRSKNIKSYGYNDRVNEIYLF